MSMTTKMIVRIVCLFVLILLVCVALCLLIFGVLPNRSEEIKINEYFSSSLVDSEVIYTVLVLCGVLVVGLVFLIIATYSTASTLVNYDLNKKRLLLESARFTMLNAIDEEYKKYKAPEYESERSLADICDGFRNYAANKLGLYYDIEDIRRFVAGLGVTKLMILQGMSGTGKTSLAYAFGQYIENDSVVVPVQPMWKERSDIIGYFNEFTKKFNETKLLRKMYEAGYKKEMYITILDEVNISRIEYYFAEFLSLLELPDEEKRYLDVVSDVWESDPAELKEGKIKLPPNMWFVGTANNDDSTFAISDKVYDRAMIINLEKKSNVFDAPETESVKISYERWCELIAEAKGRYSLSSKQAENIKKLDEYLIEKFRISFGNRIMKQIYEYVPVYMACGGSEVEALDDIFSKKVLRKLEAQSPSYVRSEAPALIELMDEIFGADKMKSCKAYLHRFELT